MISEMLQLSGNITVKQKSKYDFNFTKADLGGLCNYLLDVDSSTCTSTNDVDVIWSLIKNSILDALICLFQGPKFDLVHILPG